MSPCFDFTALTNPHISFLIYWECEFRYDGMVLQVSTNDGATWSNVGAYNDPNDCLNQNWYNYQNINWLTTASPKHGWTGRTGATQGSCLGGNGSNGWVEASHCVALGGSPSVRFRFLFGSGTTCNNYAGIGIDRFHIENVEPLNLTATATCAANGTFQFTSNSTGCPSLVWNFGDASSGILNTSSASNPTHAYQSAGAYSVTVSAGGACYTSESLSINIYNSSLSVDVVNTSCNGSTGAATAVVTPTAPGAVYSFNGNTPTASNQATNLAAGNYSVTYSAPNACSVAQNFTIAAPTPPSVSVTIQNPTCAGNGNGSAAASVIGGTPPYTYNWSTGSTGNINSNLSAGNYLCIVTDQALCADSVSIVVNDPLPVLLNANANSTTCGLNNGSISAIGSGGTGSIGLTIQPPLTNWNAAPAGNYTITATDQNGCSVSNELTVDSSSPVVLSLLEVDQVSCNGGSDGHALLDATPAGIQWSWSPAVSATLEANNLSAGSYTVTATANGICSNSISFTIQEPNALQTQIDASQVTVCEGQAITLQASTSGGTAPYSYIWSPGGAESVLQYTPLVDETISLTVTDSNGCVATANEPLQVSNPSNVQLSSNAPQCPGQSITIVASGSASVRWPDNSVGSSWTFSPLEDSLVNLTVGATSLCPLDTSILIGVYSSPNAEFSFSTSPLEFTPVTVNFSNTSTNATMWTWTFDDGSSSLLANPTHIYSSEGLFRIQLIAENQFGCSDSANKWLAIGAIGGEFGLFIPNAFTPDNDGVNDVLKIAGYGLEQFEMTIYNRWGEQVFQTDSLGGVWMGDINGGAYFVPDGIYNWRVRAKTGHAEWIERRGSILVIR